MEIFALAAILGTCAGAAFGAWSLTPKS